ncbi:MAG TPA: tetratricopeptide repeat protein [Gemmatimonadales bacterium]|nr:tetratricopeptide repeat protein [Gemmatimonadales bacterium]
MAAPSEIEKLERRYAENPDGRFFAPLADAYRKAGSLDRALELVRAGLVKHPDYLSARIVLGRCLLDKGDDAEAERTFRSVLDLDSENIIALKSLAEITERTGRATEARKWLQQLLVVDSMNAEAEADLQRLGGPLTEQATQPMEAVHADAGAAVSFADVAAEVEPAAILEARLPAAPAAAVEPPAAAAPGAVPAAVTAEVVPPAVTAPPPPTVAEAAPAPAAAPAPVAEAPAPPVEVAAPPVEIAAAPVEVVAAAAAPAAAAPEPPAPEPGPTVSQVVLAARQTAPIESEPGAPAPVAEAPVPSEAVAPYAAERAVEAPEAHLEVVEPAPPAFEMPPLEAPPEAVAVQVEGDVRAEAAAPAAEAAATPAAEPAEPVPDRHPLPQDLQVTDAGLDLMPFDDSLAWGTGERSSRAIRAEDVATFAHDDALTSPAVEFMAGLEGAAPPAPGAPAAPAGATPASQGRAEAGEFTIEHDEDLQSFDSVPREPEPPVNVELPADLSGAYSIIDVPEPAPTSAVAPRPSAGLPLIMPEDVTPAEELARPSSKLVQMVSPAPPEEKGGGGAPAMLSETLGDLYLQQGFREEAAAVYRRLLEQRPGDAGLASKLRALEAPPNLSADSQGAESVGSWLKRVAAARLRSPNAPAPAPPAGPTPLDAAFAAAAPEPSGEPAHPAHEAFSLDQIFGAGEAPASAPPAAAATPAPPPAAGTSFDEFFGAPHDQGSVRPATEAPDEPAQSGEEDLSAFNAWLQGLKR